MDDQIPQLGPLNRADKILVVVSTVVGIVTLLGNFIIFWFTVERQANIAAQDVILKHFEYAAERGIGLGEAQTKDESSWEYQSTARHAGYIANLVYDMTEDTQDRDEWEAIIRRELLQPYSDALSQRSMDCSELDSDFANFATHPVGIAECTEESEES